MTILRGAKYVLVMVEYFSKWIELMVLRQNSSKLGVATFLNHLLVRFGAPTDVLTYQRRDFLGSFQELYTKALIDHRTTSRDDVKANELGERVMQTIKHNLCKYGLLAGNYRNWNLKLSGIAMGYYFSQ